MGHGDGAVETVVTAGMTGRVLITGAAGFLGANIARALGLPLVAGRRRPAGVMAGEGPDRLDLLAGRADTVLFDVEWPVDRLADILIEQGIAAIVHCAAYGVDYGQSDFETALRVNAGGSDRLVQAAARAGVRRFIQIGTGHEYGELDAPITEEACPRPRGIYGVSKLAATSIALERARVLGLPLCVMRPFGMYGPLEGAHKFVPMVMRASLGGEGVGLSPGLQRRDYCYVDDVVAAIRTALVQPVLPAGQIINLSSGRAITLRALAAAAVAAVGGDPARLRWGERDYRPDDSMVIEADVTKAARLLNWRAGTGLTDGMAHMVGIERRTVRVKN